MRFLAKFTELEKKNRTELISEHDKLASNTIVGTQYYLEAIRHKSLE